MILLFIGIRCILVITITIPLPPFSTPLSPKRQKTLSHLIQLSLVFITLDLWVSSHVTAANDNKQNLVKPSFTYSICIAHALSQHTVAVTAELLLTVEHNRILYSCVHVRKTQDGNHQAEVTVALFRFSFHIMWLKLWAVSRLFSLCVSDSLSVSLPLLLFPHICARFPVH